MKLEMNIDEYLPLREVVFNTLRHAIVKGEFKPGERLMEMTLANKLGVSRTPVREAIRMLELEGLVVMIPRRGAEVAKITISDLKDALDVRMAIEELAVGLACDRITEEGKEELKAACEEFNKRVASKKIDEIVEGDVLVHDVIFRATNNTRLINIAHNLREQVYRFRVEYVKDFDYHDNLIKEHDEIKDAIISGDKEIAKAIMKKHIYNQEQIVIKNLCEAAKKGVEI